MRSDLIGYLGTMKSNDLMTVDPEILGGTPVFKGARVPVKTLFDYLEDNVDHIGSSRQPPNSHHRGSQRHTESRGRCR